ncbi:MAG: hypothetical protein IT175_10715, partial [Acidobacteria bacterium]|nr:hypothetical protein [Acidobacteriota bacterium]
LIQMVSERAGIAPETARTAVETVLGFIKERLPEPLASQVDGFIGGEAAADGGGDVLGDIAGKIGGLLG